MQSIAFRMIVTFLVALPIAGILLAWRNMARRRSDFRGALRVAAALLMFALGGAILIAHHTFADIILEWWTLSNLVAVHTFWALMCFVLYIAIEPLARRRWPYMLVSWVRLLDGRFRDPMIGRDVLAGAVGGVFVIVVWHGTALVSGANPILLTTLTRSSTGVMALGGVSDVASTILTAMFEAIFRTLGAVTLLIILRGVLRNERMTDVVAAVLMAITFLGDANGTLAGRTIYSLICGAVVVIVLRRFGFLALVSAATFITVLWRVPLTLDPSSWYFNGSATALLFLAAIAIYGFVISTAGKSRLPRLAFEV
jgi:hypothetical protein